MRTVEKKEGGLERDMRFSRWMSDSGEHLLENMRAQYSSVSEEKICTPKPSWREGDSCENKNKVQKPWLLSSPNQCVDSSRKKLDAKCCCHGEYTYGEIMFELICEEMSYRA